MTSINIRKLAHSEMDLYRKPLLPEKWSCFPVDKEIDTQSLKKILQKDLDKIRSGAEKDPFSNSITMLALDISRRLEKEKLNYSALEALIQRLTVGSIGFKADRLKKYIGEVDKKKNILIIRKIIDRFCYDINGKKISSSEFKKKIEDDIFGIVLTAHPTFGTPNNILKDLASMITMTDPSGKTINRESLKKIIKKIFKTEQRPDSSISLDFEHELSMVSLKNLQIAMRIFFREFIYVCKKNYPENYLEHFPKFLSLHSWVGYDVDGRGDISWVDTFSKRLKLKIEQLKLYLDYLEDIFKKKIKVEENVYKQFKIVFDKITQAIKINSYIDDELNEKGLIKDNKKLKKISKFIVNNKSKLIVDVNWLSENISLLNKLIQESKFKDKNKVIVELQTLLIEIKNFGLGLAKTQVRLNANQLNNAISKEIGLSGDPDDPSNKITYLNSVSRLIEKVNPVSINFGTLSDENMNAKRYFMILSQMFKYIELDRPIRFLIAECDFALTALTALYYAKLFNIDERVDISPLFETEKALANGHLIIESLVKNPHYRKYLIKRGRICIQTGYSDAGRYLGQTAAVLSIENLQRKVAKVLLNNNLSGIKLLIFDTHGESIGRGGHPVSLQDRLQYVNCNYTRKILKSWNVSLSQEISFQ